MLEWEVRELESSPSIRESAARLGPACQSLIRELGESGKLEILQLRDGLRIRTTSWVGRITLGGLSLHIRPKLSGMPLLQLLRYTYSLRDLRIFSSSNYDVTAIPFEDLLIEQLVAEAAELLSRGLHRDYLRHSGNLESPRGRIDFGRVPHSIAQADAGLPCTYYDRSEDVPLNRVLLAGLHLGRTLAKDGVLRQRIGRLEQTLEQRVSRTQLTSTRLIEAWHAIDRRSAAYAASLTLIELLHSGLGLSGAPHEAAVEASSFLFDMNRFFQRLLSRFFHVELSGFSVVDEFRLYEVFAANSSQPPRRPPTIPRPDFAILADDRVIQLLDAKYRDLWDQNCPPAMLYQLAIYALSGTNRAASATILYPTMTRDTRDQVIEIRDPGCGLTRGTVVLRPVDLLYLSGLVSDTSSYSADRQRQKYAHDLCFGSLTAEPPLRKRGSFTSHLGAVS